MRKNDLQGLEIRNVDGTNVSSISGQKALEVRKKMDDAGLAVWSVGSPIGKIDIEADDFCEHLDAFKHTLELADILGAGNIRLFSFYIPRGKAPEIYKNQVIDRLGQFLELAEGTGVRLCHENEKGIYGDIASRCLQLHEALPGLCGIFDPANFVQCGQDTLQAWDMLGSYCKYMHIKDALADGNVVPAGAGIGNLPVILKAFMARGGDAVTVEPHLKVFDGLKALEKGETGMVGAYTYATNEDAFDAACNALKALL